MAIIKYNSVDRPNVQEIVRGKSSLKTANDKRAMIFYPSLHYIVYVLHTLTNIIGASVPFTMIHICSRMISQILTDKVHRRYHCLVFKTVLDLDLKLPSHFVWLIAGCNNFQITSTTAKICCPMWFQFVRNWNRSVRTVPISHELKS